MIIRTSTEAEGCHADSVIAAECVEGYRIYILCKSCNDCAANVTNSVSVIRRANLVYAAAQGPRVLIGYVKLVYVLNNFD